MSYMLEEWHQIYENGTEEERELMNLTLQAIKQRRERGSSYISGLMGLQGEFLDERTYQFTVPVTCFMNNSLDIVHGGITATLIDSAMGSLINRSLPEGQYAVTTDLQVRYLMPGKGETVHAIAKLIHRGSKLAIMEGSLVDDHDRLVAHATGTFMILGMVKG